MTEQAARPAPDAGTPSGPGATADRPARRSGRRPGHSGTRELIAATARRQFAAQGYDRTSLRSVAAEAGVDPGLVGHYFGTKQQLFTVVVELPFDPEVVVRQVVAGDRADIGRRLAAVMAGVLSSPAQAATMTGLVRCAATEPAAAAIVRDRFTRDVLTLLADSLGVDHPETRAALAASQIVGMVMAREVIGLEPLRALSRGQLVDLVGAALQRHLTEPWGA